MAADILITLKLSAIFSCINLCPFFGSPDRIIFPISVMAFWRMSWMWHPRLRDSEFSFNLRPMPTLFRSPWHGTLTLNRTQLAAEYATALKVTITYLIDINNRTSYTLSNLQDEKTHYTAATAYDQYGDESDFSDEAIFNVPPFDKRHSC